MHRENRIDLLRFIGLSLIILAHVHPGPYIFQLRNFDVPLMVIASGMAYGLSGNVRKAYFRHLVNRACRLVFPVWVFLTFYFIFLWITGYPQDLPGKNVIIESYLLCSGIGYVWIIRVFLLIAVIAHFVLALDKKIVKNNIYMLAIALLYIVYEILLYVFSCYFRAKYYFMVEGTLFYMLPYGCIFAFGVRLRKMSKNEIFNFSLLFSLIFIMLFVYLYFKNGEIVGTQGYKYPPRLYYISYGMFASLFAFILSEYILGVIGGCSSINLIITFVSKNSLSIYLWHIPLLSVFSGKFYYNYFVVYFLALFITYVQIYTLRRFSFLSVRS